MCVGCGEGEKTALNVVRATSRKDQTKAQANQAKALKELEQRQEQIKEAKGCTCGWVYCEYVFLFMVTDALAVPFAKHLMT